MKVLLDTNFLIDVVRFRVDLEEITGLIGRNELFTLVSVERELKKISQKASRTSMHAKAVLKLIKEHDIKILDSKELPDSAMLKLSSEKTIVATNDVELRKELKAFGRKTIYLKSKKHLAIG